MCSKQKSGRIAAWLKWKTWKSLGAWFSCLNFLLSLASIIFFLIAAFMPSWGSGAQQSPWWSVRQLWGTAPGGMHHFPGEGPASFPAFHGTKIIFIPSSLVRNSAGIFRGSKILWEKLIHPWAPANDDCSLWEYIVLVFVHFLKIFSAFLAGALEGNTFY